VKKGNQKKSDLIKGYREMGNDLDQEREAAEWIEGVGRNVGSGAPLGMTRVRPC
jgi:hypothetical protein